MGTVGLYRTGVGGGPGTVVGTGGCPVWHVAVVLLVCMVASSGSIGVLCRVCRWWIRGCVLTTLGAVASVDVEGMPTLGGVASGTVAGLTPLRMDVRWVRMRVCWTRASVVAGSWSWS